MSRQKPVLVSSSKFSHTSIETTKNMDTSGQMIKGDGPRYIHDGGDNDKYRYSVGHNRELIFLRRPFVESLNDLKPYATVLPDRLPINISEIFTSVMEQGAKLHETPLYDLFLESINTVFTGPVLPGTVGSYFAGCSIASKENNLQGCDPRCLASLPLAGMDGSNVCTRTVMVIKDGVLSYIQDKKTSSAILLIYDIGIQTVDAKIVDAIVASGVTSLDVLFLNPDGSFSPVVSRLPADLVASTKTKALPESTPSTGNSAGWIAFWIIVILIVIGLILLGAAYYISKNKKVAKVNPMEITSDWRRNSAL